MNAGHEVEGEAMRKAMHGAHSLWGFAGHVHGYVRFMSWILIIMIAWKVYHNSQLSSARNLCGPVHITIGDDDIREGLAFEILSKQDLTGVALALTTAAPKRGSLGKGERERESEQLPRQ